LDGPEPLGTLRLSQAESMARIDAVKKGVDVEALFQDRLGQVAEETEALLDQLLASTPLDGERARPARLLDAMRSWWSNAPPCSTSGASIR
jgi:predicted DNA-binding ribbon-helix-helix protein